MLKQQTSLQNLVEKYATMYANILDKSDLNANSFESGSEHLKSIWLHHTLIEESGTTIVLKQKTHEIYKYLVVGIILLNTLIYVML